MKKLLCLLSVCLLLFNTGTINVWAVERQSSVVSEEISVADISGLKVKTGSISTVKISWKTLKSVSGYKVQQKVNGKWKSIKTLSASTNYYKFSNNLVEGNNYFRVRAYKKTGDLTAYGDYATIKVYIPKTTTIKSVTTPTKCHITKSGKKYHFSKTCANMVKTLTITDAKKKGYGACKKCATTYVNLQWSEKSNVSGYAIYRKVTNGNYEEIKSTSSLSFKDKTVKSGKTYTYKIRTYKVKNGVKVYSKYSTTKTIKVK